MRVKVENEVARLLARQVAPRLPRSKGELEFELGRRLYIEELRLREEASVLGGIALKGDIDGLLLAGGSIADLRDRLDQAAGDLAGEMSRDRGSAGGEAARILAERARRR